MEERVYCTYIVASRSHTLYIGMTGNLLKRVFEHKQRTHEGFSSKYNCNRLERTNPTWNDLSEGWYVIDPTVDKLGQPGRPHLNEANAPRS
jgi:putative endonuclease